MYLCGDSLDYSGGKNGSGGCHRGAHRLGGARIAVRAWRGDIGRRRAGTGAVGVRQ